MVEPRRIKRLYVVESGTNFSYGRWSLLINLVLLLWFCSTAERLCELLHSSCITYLGILRVIRSLELLQPLVSSVPVC